MTSCTTWADAKNRMKVCFVSSEYPPDNPHGGISTFTSTTARALANAGHEVHVITWRFSANPLAFGQVVQSAQDKVIVHHVIMPPPRLHQRAATWVPYRLWVLKEVIRIRSLDVVQCPDNNADGLFLGHKLGRTRVPRLITWCVGTPTFAVRQLVTRPAQSGVQHLLSVGIGMAEKVQIKTSDALLSPTGVSATITARNMRIDQERIKVLPCGIEPEQLRRSNPVDIELPHDYILHLGRLEARKGVHILAKSLREVFRKHPDVRMVFIGNDTPFLGSTMARFILETNREYARNILFLGYQSEDVKKLAIRNCRFMVCPSLIEGFGYSALEAMVLGKAVVATSGTGLSEVVQDGRSGRLVKPGEPLDLAQAMNDCLENDILELEGGALERSRSFDITRLLPSYERFYAEVIADR